MTLRRKSARCPSRVANFFERGAMNLKYKTKLNKTFKTFIQPSPRYVSSSVTSNMPDDEHCGSQVVLKLVESEL